MKENKQKMRKMDNKIKTNLFLVILIACVLVLFMLVWSANITGRVTGVAYHCTDSDGDDIFNAGKVELFAMMEEKINTGSYMDYCSDEETVTEYYCVWENYNYLVDMKQEKCELGCSEGACVKPRTPRLNVIDYIYRFLKK